MENTLVKADITVNKNMVPFDSRSPFQTSGLRLGTPAVTTRGLKENHMTLIVDLIDEVIHSFDNEKVIASSQKKGKRDDGRLPALRRLKENMKTIYIVRHAKSSWENLDLPDEKRPLTEKGIVRTRKVARYLSRQQIPVELIISSHAVRAFETARLLAEGLNYPVSGIRVELDIYLSEADQFPALFLKTPDNITYIMIVGHNPSITDFVNQYISRSIESLPTSGVVSISFETDTWEKISMVKSRVNFIIIPDKITPED